MGAVLGIIDRALGGPSHLLGEDFTAADVMIGSTLSWASALGVIGPELRATMDYLGRLTVRPAFRRATAD